MTRKTYFLRLRFGALLCFLMMAFVFILQGCTSASTPKQPETKRPVSAKVEAPVHPHAKGPIRIVIDPGHGGESAGAVGVTKVLEKQITLEIALEVAKLIQTNLGVELVLTRNVDKDVALVERTELANDAQGTIFVSIHANASENHRRRGVEVYYLDNTADEASLKLAARENDRPQSDEEEDLSFIVSDVIQTAKMGESITMAHYVYESLLQRLRTSYKKIKGNGVMKAPFSVLVGAHMPSILVEVSYIDEKEEGKRLDTPEYRKAIAEGIFSGIRRFLKKSMPHG